MKDIKAPKTNISVEGLTEKIFDDRTSKIGHREEDDLRQSK